MTDIPQKMTDTPQKTETLKRSAPPEGPTRRNERRWFFRGWAIFSAVGAVGILALSLYAVREPGIARAAAIASIAVAGLLIFSALAWLVRYIIQGNRRARNENG